MGATDIAASFDYFNPFMSVRIVTSSGDIYPLWTSKAGGQSISVPAIKQTLKALSFLTELQVFMDLGGIPRITARIEPPYLDAIKFMDSDLIAVGSNMLQVQYGYAKGVLRGGKVGPLLSETLQGFILEPHVTWGIDTQITITAQGVKASESSNRSGSGETLSGTRKSIIEMLCQKENLKADFTEAVAVSQVKAALDKEAKVAQGWRTNFFFLHTLVRDCGCYAVIRRNDGDQGVYELIPLTALASQKPVLTLAMFHLPKGSVGGTTYPLLSAQTDFQGIWMPGVRTLIMRDIDSKDKIYKEKRIDDKEAKTPRTGPGASGVKDSKFEPGADPVKTWYTQPDSGDPGNTTAVEQATAAFNTQSLAMAIPLEVETVGVPTIQPGMKLKVKGLGHRIDDPVYTVQEVIQIINGSGYVTRMKLIGNTVEIIEKQLEADLAGSVNKNEVQDDSANDTVRKTSPPER